MKNIYLLLTWLIFLLYSQKVWDQIRKIDTTIKIANVGYRIICSNKDPERNQLDIKPIGFDHDARESVLFIKGKIIRTEIDDLNGDSYPDAVIYTLNSPKGEYGNAYAIVSLSNKSFTAVGLPDVLLDAKYKNGYRGHDEFSLLEGTLMRKFPVYQADDKEVATGGRRVIQYVLSGSDDTGYKFKIQQSFETK